MRRWLPALTTALAAAIVAPAPSAHALTLARADLQGTNGYKIRIDAIGGAVTVSAKDDGAGASYSAKGSVGRGHFEADLGRFGSVDLEFEPRGNAECRGIFKVRRGTWTGAVQFVAEAGFTTASATTASGQTLRQSSSCARRERGNGSEAVFVTVVDRSPSAEPETFIGVASVPERKPNIFASQSRTEDGIEISNFATDRFGQSRFRYDSKRRRATVRPHAPFSGRGEARGRKWTGNLTVTMPATGEVPLTGPNLFAIFETLDLDRPLGP